MNRAERRHRSLAVFKRRLKKLRLPQTAHWAKRTSTLCSCFLCDPHKHGGKDKFAHRRRECSDQD